MSNGARVEGAALRVSPYQREDAPHGCALCPSNLCKGGVLDELLAQYNGTRPRIVYVGDGGGDLCPCLRLRSELGDVCCARKDYKLSRELERRGRAQRTWVDAAALLAIFEDVFCAPTERAAPAEGGSGDGGAL